MLSPRWIVSPVIAILAVIMVAGVTSALQLPEGVLGGLTIAALPIGFLVPFFLLKGKNEADLGDIEGIRRRLTQDTDETGNPGFALLREYHAQGLAQAKVSFWFSLVFASIGFAIIATGLGITFLGPEDKNGSFIMTVAKPSVALISGTIIDAVAALFFVQSNKARQLMTEFFDKLRIDRKLDEALRLTDEIQDKTISGNLRAMMALRFVDLNVDLPTLQSILLLGRDPTAEDRAKRAAEIASIAEASDVTKLRAG